MRELNSIGWEKPDFTAEELINDFRKFVIYVWWYLNLPKPTPMQLYIADYLQEGHTRMMLQALRGIGKTYITGAFVAWRLLRNPNERVLIVSQTGGHAENIAIFIKRLIHTVDILNHLKARKDQRDSTLAFEVNGCEVAVQPSVKAVGITGQLQGNRASLLISDDVEGMQNSATEQMRVKLREATAEYEAILQTNEDSQIIVLGTPQSAESIYNGFREDGYVTRIFPARYPEDISVYNGCLAPYIMETLANDATLVGKPIDSRFTEEDLQLREARYGKSGFKLQFMLDTSLSDAERYPLKLNDLIVTNLGETEAPDRIMYSSNPVHRYSDLENVGFSGDGFYMPSSISNNVVEYQGVHMGIDISGRGKDSTGVCVVAHLLGKLYLLEAVALGGTGYSEENMVKMAEIAKKYKVNKVFSEDNMGDGMFSSLFQPILNAIYPCMIEGVRANTQKELRIIDTLEPVMNQHRLIVDTDVVRRDIKKYLGTNEIVYSLFYQMTHITRDRGSLAHDDLLDVVAMVVQQWQRVLIQDPNNALERYKEQQTIEYMMEMALRHSNKKLSGGFTSGYGNYFKKR